MAAAPEPDDARLARVSEICTELPEAERELAGRHAGFRVRGKIFAWYLDDHHGDGRVALTCKAPPGRNEELMVAQPDRYFLPSYVGPKGWVGVYLDAGTPDWEEIAGLVVESYLLTAPKRLAAQVLPGG